MYKRLLLFLCAIILLTSSYPVKAQEGTGPIYIVQPGDSLSSIASRFSVDMNELMEANGIVNANQLTVGQQLIIPGLEGVNGVLDTTLINFGNSYRALIRKTQISEALFKKLNHLVSPNEFYVGASMIVPTQANGAGLNTQVSPASGESMLEAAIKKGIDPWTLAHYNQLRGSWDVIPGDTLFAPGGEASQNAVHLPSAFVSAEIRSLPIKQGGTTEIVIHPAEGVTLSGVLVDRPLTFFPLGDGRMVALQGVLVTLPLGVYPLRLDAKLPDGSTESFEQMILVTRGDQRIDEQVVPSIDPATLEPETLQIESIVATNTPQKYWDGDFILPVGLPSCITEWFGTPRYFFFKDERFSYFHSGVDYGVCSQEHPFDIYAAAPGVVAYTGSVFLRGNATIIDNGWGVYTLYAHQEEIYVTVGQAVPAGQVIGKIGATGHVTGPHLHFEMWVGGVQVNPLDWLKNTYP